ncbi:MAG TPA: TadE/TadG family type IV pilus assembly protein [Terracidiphilus sp.]|nr:TadE/TadG family type IV pilus assembly protein [Terracidiphilus sp.]
MLRGKEEGQALVETALSMSLFVVLMLGAVEFGRLGFAAIEVNNAAKAAAQYGSQDHARALDQSGMLQAARSEFVNPSALSMTSPSGTTGYACNCASDGSTVNCTANDPKSPVCPGSYSEVTVTVQVQTSFNPLIHVPGLPATYNLVGTAKQKVLQ